MTEKEARKRWPAYREVTICYIDDMVEDPETGELEHCGHHVCKRPWAVVDHEDGRYSFIVPRGEVDPKVAVESTSRAAFDEILRIHG